MWRILLLSLTVGVTIAAAYTSSPPPPSCGEGEVYDNCPNSCYEPVCGDNGMQLCAGIISCDPPKCVCDRTKEYARDPSTGRCVRREQCPSWTLNPCTTVKCSSGMVCQAKDGRGECVKETTIDAYPVTLNACAATSCMVGSVCVEEGGVARCVPPPGGNDNCSLPFEEWKECASCEPSCEMRSPICIKMCQPPRCMCQQGFFRSGEGKCVTENDCDIAAMPPTPPTCSRDNEEYRECSSACEPSCREKDQEMVCPPMCDPPSCQCKPGFYRAENGECVPASQCETSSSPQCKANEVFLNCSSMCEPQCGQYEPMACILMCGPPKCQCTDGFYRNWKGECVTREGCDKTPNPSTPGHPACKRNQIFAECSSVCIPKCGEYEVRPCMAMCGAPKCQCDQGFYLDNHGECVTREECDRQSSTPKTPSQSDCQPNEIFRECSSQCEEKCGEKLTRACPASCGPPKCQCDDGFLRNKAGECVLKSECDEPLPHSQADCGPNMTFRNCSSPCQSKCGDYIAKPCIERCDPPKCECNAGFYFNRVGDCVSREDCELDVPFTCANIDCRSGMVCKMKNGEPVCVHSEVLTCNTVKCAGGHRCEISPEGNPTCIPSITCANVRCAGPCTDTPSGPHCGPRPLVLPISVGPTSSPGCPQNEETRNCTNKCNEPFCGDDNYARRCALVCLTPECECIEGFVRDGEKGCVKREECTKKEEQKEQEVSSPCARRNCGIAARCIEERGRAKCIPIEFNNQQTTYASSSPSVASPPPSFHSFPSLPDSCDQVKCLNGGICVMEEVKCISGPCKPVPKCKGGNSPSVIPAALSEDSTVSTGFGSVYRPYADRCDQLRCKSGEECTMERIPCFAPPCKKGAICRPANKVCRKEHEVWNNCFHGCGETCQERNPSCTEQCGPGGCICDTFYIRDEVSGECVRLENCPSSRDIPIQKPRALTIDWFTSSPVNPLPPPQTCDGFDCPEGQECTLPPMACPVPPCTPRPTCVPRSSFRAYDVIPSCEGHSCPKGQKCQLQEVQCIRAPCYPIPECVLDMVPPTCNLPCPYGQTCVLETVLCKKAPCPRRPSCRLLQVDPIPQTCAAVSCPVGENCVIEPLPCLVAPCPIRAICRPVEKKCEKKNEMWSQCFTGCEATCGERNKMCTLQCGPGGCQCASGFIRNEKNGECVLERDCPLESEKCPSNETFDRCFHGCEATCEQLIPFCTKQCGPGGCRCSNGLVRDPATKKCIPQSECNAISY